MHDTNRHHRTGRLPQSWGETPDVDSHAEQDLFQVKTERRRELLEPLGGLPDYDSTSEYDLFQVTTERKVVGPLEVQLIIDKQPLTMELDTGAAVTLMSESTCRQLWPDRPLQLCTMRLCTYSGEQLPVVGQLEVVVECGDQSATLLWCRARGQVS